MHAWWLLTIMTIVGGLRPPPGQRAARGAPGQLTLQGPSGRGAFRGKVSERKRHRCGRSARFVNADPKIVPWPHSASAAAVAGRHAALDVSRWVPKVHAIVGPGDDLACETVGQ
jgi:hypothetical protein